MTDLEGSLKDRETKEMPALVKCDKKIRYESDGLDNPTLAKDICLSVDECGGFDVGCVYYRELNNIK